MNRFTQTEFVGIENSDLHFRSNRVSLNSVALVSTVTSQQEGPGFRSSLGFLWSLHVLPGFSPGTKDMHGFWLTGDSKMTVGKNGNLFRLYFVSCSMTAAGIQDCI